MRDHKCFALRGAKLDVLFELGWISFKFGRSDAGAGLTIGADKLVGGWIARKAGLQKWMDLPGVSRA